MDIRELYSDMEHEYKKFSRRIQVNFEELEQQISDYAKANSAAKKKVMRSWQDG